MEENTAFRFSRASSIPSSPPLDPRYRATSPTSSEPPLFSSDGPLESEELANYESPRVKRKYSGPWWNSELGGAWSTKKTKLSRNFDSGIHMMSDGSFGSDDSQECPQVSASQQRQANESESFEHEINIVSKEEHALLTKLKSLVENNATQYDFSGMQLRDNSLRHLRLIKPVIDPPKGTGVAVPAEGQYRSMIPELKLYLDKNHLPRLHATLFDLEHLSHLSLMNSQIEELPPQIAKLRNLKSLNLTFNRLQWLPCEILDMLSSATEPGQVMTFGNPVHELAGPDETRSRPIIPSKFVGFMTPISQASIQENLRIAYEMLSFTQNPKDLVWLIRLWEARLGENASASHHLHCPTATVDAWENQNDFRLRFFGATPPSYFDSRGNLVKGSIVASKCDPILHTSRGAWGMPKIFPPRPSSRNKVHSIMNQAMRNALKRWSPAMIREELDILGYLVPPDVEKLLQCAEGHLKPQVLPKCHVCAREYLIPAAEWYEIWHPGSRRGVRVRVRVCSWACVPDKIAMPPQQELVIERKESW